MVAVAVSPARWAGLRSGRAVGAGSRRSAAAGHLVKRNERFFHHQHAERVSGFLPSDFGFRASIPPKGAVSLIRVPPSTPGPSSHVPPISSSPLPMSRRPLLPLL